MSQERPWERRKGETAIAYHAFLAYRDLGRGRSLPEAQRVHNQSLGNHRGGKSHALNEWSARHDWVERCRLWDNHLQTERDQIATAETARWERRRLENQEANFDLATKLRERANALLAHPIVKSKGKTDDGTIIVEPAGWTQKDIAAIAKVASDLGAIALASQVRPPTEKPLEDVDEIPLCEDPDEIRRLELHRLDLISAALWPKVREGDTKAIDTAMKIMALRAKYLGITAPLPIEPESVLIERFESLVEEAYGKDPAGLPDAGS